MVKVAPLVGKDNIDVRVLKLNDGKVLVMKFYPNLESKTDLVLSLES